MTTAKKATALSPFRTRTDVIDKRPGRYLSFPDVVKTPSGKLLVAYRDGDIHYPPKPEETFLMLTESSDQGQTWSEPRRFPFAPRDNKVWAWHCPRLSLMQDGRLALLCDLSAPELGDVRVYFMTSTDEGLTWTEPLDTGVFGIIPDRLIELSKTEWVFTVHYTRPKIKHYYQELYATTDAGKTWALRSVIAEDPLLCFCEASIILLPDKSLLCFLRENSFLNLPTYVSVSRDAGHTWSKPVSHPTHGHRPCAGLVTGKGIEPNTVLLTHRNVAGTPGLCAWVGKTDETGATVGGADYDRAAVFFGREGLHILTSDDPFSAGIFFLQPLLDWNATFRFRAKFKRVSGSRCSCGIRAGALFRFFSDAVVIEHLVVSAKKKIEKVVMKTVPLDPSDWHEYEIRGENREIQLYVDNRAVFTGKLRGVIPSADRRISFGNIFETHPAEMGFVEHRGESVWREVELNITEKSGRNVEWSWSSATGLFPNEEQRRREIQIDVEDSYEWYDSGYSGWTQLGPNKVYCVDYRRGKEKKPYIVGHTIRIDPT